jgi:hypothetical protein
MQNRNIDVRAEYDARNLRFVEDLATARLKVRNSNARSIIQARELLRYAGLIQANAGGNDTGNLLASGDALIASCCLDLAHEIGEQITLFTGDAPLYAVLYINDHFRSALRIRLLGVPKIANMPAQTF